MIYRSLLYICSFVLTPFVTSRRDPIEIVKIQLSLERRELRHSEIQRNQRIHKLLTFVNNEAVNDVQKYSSEHNMMMAETRG